MAIQNGKIYRSFASAFQVLVRPKRDVWNYDGSVLMDTIPPLTAEFGYHGGEFKFHNNLTGATDTAADIRGHFFDSAAQAEEKGWTQEEHDMVIKALDRLCSQQPEYVWEVTRAKVAAPWPTYDTTQHGKVAELATTLGLVAEALAYEQQEKNRKTVVEALEAELAKAQEVSDEELVAS